MIRIIERLLSRSLKQRLYKEARLAIVDRMKEIESQLPKIFLEEKHIKNCELVLNRRAMLQRMGKQNVVAELGVDRGKFSNEILDIIRPDVLHLIDSWKSTRYNGDLFKEVKKKFDEKIENKTVQIHRKLSVDASWNFEKGYFDMIYIDTDHSYQTTREELNAYESKMKPDGFIAGHDYSMANWKWSIRYGVIEAVHEFCVASGWELIYLTVEPLESQSFAIRRMKQAI